MNNNLFQSLPIVAHAIGQQCGVSVRIGGTSAYTDGHTVVLPYPKDFNKDVLLGFLVHEASHIRFSDFSTLANIRLPIVKHLQNIYEDTRIERLINSVYRGANGFLKQTLKHVFGNEYTVDSNATPLTILMDFIAYDVWDRYRLSGDILTPHAMKAQTLAEEIFPAELLESLKSINNEIATAKSSADCLVMAEKVVEELRKFFKDQPQAMQSAHGGQSQKGEIGEKMEKANSGSNQTNHPNQQDSKSSVKGSESSSSQGSSKSGSDSDKGKEDSSTSSTSGEGTDDQTGQSSTTQSSSSSNSKSASKKAGSRNATRNGESHDEGKETDQAKEAIKALEGFEDQSKDISKTLAKEIEEQAVNKGIEAIESSQGASKRAATPREDVNALDFLNECRALSNGLKRQLAGLVTQASRTKTMTRHAGRKIAVNKVSRLAYGNTRVFQKRVEHESTASAIHVLLDMSGSMRQRSDVAAKAATGMLMALMSLSKTNPALSIFPASNDRLNSEIILGHGEKLTRGTNGRFNRIQASGGTPLAEALVDVVQQLALTKEKRKIVIVITDGVPDDTKKAKNYLEKMAKSGIDLYGIGIGYDVSHLFDQSVTIKNVNELSKVLYELAKHTSLLAVQ